MASEPFVKHLKDYADGDRISNLPSNVTEHILECLSLKDAVRMSILSRYWKDKWVMLQQLIFDENFFNGLKMPKYFNHGPSAEFQLAYSDIVNNVLLRHTGPVRRFALYLHPKVSGSANISHWIHWICRKGVKEFTLNNTYYGRETKVPYCLFSCVSLTHLTLNHCLISPLPPAFSGFPCLTSLQIPYAPYQDANSLDILISSCPQLEHLTVYYLYSRTISIHAPKLRDLVIYGEVSNIPLKGTTKINMLSLNAYWKLNLMDELDNFFCCLPNLETLVLGQSFWQIPHKDKTPKVTSGLELLITTLKLIGMPSNCKLAVPLALKLFECSTHLQQLEIQVLDYRCYSCVDEFEIKEDCSFQRLTSVALERLSGSSHDLRLIKLLLACSPVLQVMTIELNDKIQGAEEKLKMTRELMWYPRASKNAKILFKS